MNKVKWLILVSTISLTGCFATAPVKEPFPDIPDALKEDCGSLATIDAPEVKLSDLLTTVKNNYSKFYECAAKIDGWKEWYSKQKKAHDEVK